LYTSDGPRFRGSLNASPELRQIGPGGKRIAPEPLPNRIAAAVALPRDGECPEYSVVSILPDSGCAVSRHLYGNSLGNRDYFDHLGVKI
ncbi:unnamed protein product, partial [Amoebophrya sp. A25]